MPDINDLINEMVATRMAEREGEITTFILNEFFDGDALGMMTSLEAEPARYQLEPQAREDASVVITFRDLADNRTAELVLPAIQIETETP
jgi:hypothetical protein